MAGKPGKGHDPKWPVVKLYYILVGSGRVEVRYIEAYDKEKVWDVVGNSTPRGINRRIYKNSYPYRPVAFRTPWEAVVAHAEECRDRVRRAQAGLDRAIAELEDAMALTLSGEYGPTGIREEL